MAFTDTNLAELRRFVASARKLLVEEFDGQLKAFGLHAGEGRVFDLEPLRPNLSDEEFALAQTLRQRLEHLCAALPAATPDATARAINDLLAEQAFTILNRFAAIRMAEERKLVIETIGKGFDSGGFRVWSRVFDGYFPQTYERYRAFWNATCDEISLDLGVLFDRDSLQGLLFPRENALYRLFDLMNAPGVAALWGEDETIGWIYQYFNDRDQIRESKAESATPRNSRELAERNQFFTPRYVVEFLTDNTLGRLWWEMTEGQTSLAQTCEFLALQPDETPPSRLIKDPRDLKMLDPACGSMHFGLYAFDLFLVIYDEAWDRMSDLRAEFEHDKSAYDLLVPKWILERNIWGVDIDPRAAQIAALSLWLRAGRAWNDAKIPLDARPPIEATRIVCAAPMPGDVATLRDFTARLNNPTLAGLVEAAWEKMTLAGEAGTLLQIEKDLKEAIDLAQKESFNLFSDKRADKFWDEAEKKITQTLRDFTLEIEAGGGLERQMFAADAGRGLAFIDLCRERFDVVTMNPPFGESASATKAYLRTHYPRTKNDIYAAFVERGIELLERNGMLGAITSRTGFFLTSYRVWRQDVLLESAPPFVVADLGYGVLDAMVETAAYCLKKR